MIIKYRTLETKKNSLMNDILFIVKSKKSKKHFLFFCLINVRRRRRKTITILLYSSSTPTQRHSSFVEFKRKNNRTMSTANGIHANGNVTSNDVLNVPKNDKKKEEKKNPESISSIFFSERTASIIVDSIAPTIPTVCCRRR